MTLDEAIAHAHAAKSNDINSLSGRALAVLVDAFDAKLATQANFILMPRNLTEAMKEVITNEHEIFQSAQDLYDALLKLATTTQSVADNFQEQILSIMTLQTRQTNNSDDQHANLLLRKGGYPHLPTGKFNGDL